MYSESYLPARLRLTPQFTVERKLWLAHGDTHSSDTTGVQSILTGTPSGDMPAKCMGDVSRSTIEVRILHVSIWMTHVPRSSAIPVPLCTPRLPRCVFVPGRPSTRSQTPACAPFQYHHCWGQRRWRIGVGLITGFERYSWFGAARRRGCHQSSELGLILVAFADPQWSDLTHSFPSVLQNTATVGGLFYKLWN